MVIDQFEELFTGVPADDANEFLEAVSVAVEDPTSPLRLVITLRADYYHRPLEHPTFAKIVKEATVQDHPAGRRRAGTGHRRTGSTARCRLRTGPRRPHRGRDRRPAVVASTPAVHPERAVRSPRRWPTHHRRLRADRWPRRRPDPPGRIDLSRGRRPSTCRHPAGLRPPGQPGRGIDRPPKAGQSWPISTSTATRHG